MKFITNSNAVLVDIDAHLRAEEPWLFEEPRDYARVYCATTGTELGPVSDFDVHHATGEDIVEVDNGHRSWYAMSAVAVMTAAEFAAHPFGDRANWREMARAL